MHHTSTKPGTFGRYGAIAAAAAVGALLAQSAGAAALSAQEIMVRNEHAREISRVTSEARIATGGGGDAERAKSFTWWRKLSGDRVHFNTLTRFRQPAEVRGEAILFLERAGDQNEVQLYLPAYKKIRRVESSQQSTSFMGSEFSYADIATPHVADYRYVLKKEDESCGDGGRCYVVEATPNSDETRERTGYARSVQWIRKDNFMSAAGEFYGAGGALVKRMKASSIQQVDPKNHKWMALRIRFENVKSGRYSFIEFSSVKVDADIPDSTFTPQNLSRER